MRDDIAVCGLLWLDENLSWKIFNNVRSVRLSLKWWSERFQLLLSYSKPRIQNKIIFKSNGVWFWIKEGPKMAAFRNSSDLYDSLYEKWWTDIFEIQKLCVNPKISLKPLSCTLNWLPQRIYLLLFFVWINECLSWLMTTNLFKCQRDGSSSIVFISSAYTYYWAPHRAHKEHQQPTLIYRTSDR